MYEQKTDITNPFVLQNKKTETSQIDKHQIKRLSEDCTNFVNYATPFFTFKQTKTSKTNAVQINKIPNEQKLTSMFENFDLDKELLDSTTIADSFKKSVNSGQLCKEELAKNSFCKIEPANFKSQKYPLNEEINLLNIDNNFGSEVIKSRICNRTKSANFGPIPEYFRSHKTEQLNEYLSKKMNSLKNGNESGRKVLNVDLSKNYILSYKNNSQVNNELHSLINPKTIESQFNDSKKRSFEEKISFSFLNKENSNENKLNNSGKNRQIYVNERTESRPFASSVQKKPVFEQKAGRLSDLIQMGRNDFTNQINSGMNQSQKSKLKPKVFDFYRVLEKKQKGENVESPFTPKDLFKAQPSRQFFCFSKLQN